jgi:hypothetical protein
MPANQDNSLPWQYECAILTNAANDFHRGGALSAGRG